MIGSRTRQVLGTWFLCLSRLSATISAETSQLSLCLLSSEMSSLKTPGRKSQGAAAARQVGGRVDGLKPGACSDGQKPTARQFSMKLYSADPHVIAQCPERACWVAGVALTQVSEEWGRLCPTLSEGETPFLGGRPSAGAESWVV